MNSLFAALARLLPTAAQAAQADLPHVLFERAGARAGHSPQDARELREAAVAYLSVVR